MSLSHTYTTWITELLNEDGYGNLLDGTPTSAAQMDHARSRVLAVISDLPRPSLVSEQVFQNIAFWTRYATFREMHDDIIQWLDTVDTSASSSLPSWETYQSSPYGGYSHDPYGSGWY
ncbi:hypothetical protein Q8F55_003560 [Vanrija albida]|uniref:Uncharacterized protein n=1 Tax=Vanrija albida TaxID=181172 RepID=A0ABR3Q4A8_9TREE